jgi:hypothetical protein
MTRQPRTRFVVILAAAFLSLPFSLFAQNNIIANQAVPLLPKDQLIQAELDKWEIIREYVQGENLAPGDSQNQITVSPETEETSEQEENLAGEGYEEEAMSALKAKEMLERGKKTPPRDEIIEISIDYLFSVKGQQIFEVVDDGGNRISKLFFPHRGGMLMFNGELRLSPLISVGGEFGSSDLKTVNDTDTDWVTPFNDFVWWQSNAACKVKVETWGVNMYYSVCRAKQGESQSRESKNTLDLFAVNKEGGNISIDVFGGYQYQNGDYQMTDLVDTMEWWTPVYNPIGGLNSSYKITHQGPRAGFRFKGGTARCLGKFSFAYAWLNTKADGWWNLRNYSFHQVGNNGYGIDVNADLAYKITPHLLAGLGYRYLLCKQAKLKESGEQPGFSYTDWDIIRNADSALYGPYATVKFIW